MSRHDYFAHSLTLSILLHIGVSLAVVYQAGLNSGVVIKPVIYSVTIEAGKSLGGISQVPDKAKTQLAPPKKVTQAPKKVVSPVEKAEVSLAEKKPEKKVEPPKKVVKEQVKNAPTPKEKPKPSPANKTPPKESLQDINKKLEQAMQRYLGESSDSGGKGFGAGALGGTKMGGGVVRPPEFFSYKAILEERIKSGWRWFDTSAALIAQVEFKIGPNGAITDVVIVKHSGSPEFDDSVERAVKKADPAPAPPASVYSFFSLVRMTFDPRE